MIQVDPFLCAGVGAALALSAHRQLQTQERLGGSPHLRGMLLFAAFGLVPAVLIFLFGWPAWDSMYLWDRASLPPWLPPVFALVCAAAALAGFKAVHALLRRRRWPTALALPGLLMAPAGAITVLFHDRVLHVGTIESFSAGAPINFFESSLWVPMVLINLVFIVVPGGVLAARWLKAGAADSSAI